MLPALAAALALLASPTLALWPLPRNLQTGTSVLTLGSGFNIDISFCNTPTDLQQAVAQTKTYLSTDKLERLVVGRGSVDQPKFGSAKALSSLTLKLTGTGNVTSISQEAVLALEDRDEAYTLTVPADGTAATITANSSLGLYRGLTTFTQLWYYWDDVTYTVEAPVQITDSPAYPYRGFMLDTARNYFPVADIKRQLDAMSWVKINTFHWHIVDSQSFPLQVPGFPEISAQGAYDPSYVYTASDVQDITSYATARGIDVMVEVDTPGHTAVIAESHPEHIACPYATPWTTYANEPPAGQLRFADKATVAFTASLISAVAGMFPSKYMSTGGDEINMECYTEDAQTQQIIKSTGETFKQLLSTFTSATHDELIQQGKTPVVWEEMVLSHNVTLSNATIVMVWISSEDAAAVAEKGFRIIHAPSDYFYLDCGGGGWVGDYSAGNSWCDPFKTWQLAYSFDPLANLTAAQSKLVLGGQHLLWTEQSNPSNIDPIVWPRAASSAELFWSGAGGNGTAALPRLHDVAYRMINRGVAAIALQPLWCALRPNACD